MIQLKKILSLVCLLFSLLTVQYLIAVSTLLFSLFTKNGAEADFSKFSVFLILSGINMALGLFCTFGENPMRKWAMASVAFQLLTPVVVMAGFYIGY